MKKGNLIVGVDAGTSKTTVIVGEVNTGHKPRNGSSSGGIQKAGGAYNDSPIEIIGVGSVPSTGIKKGVVVNIEKTAEAIRRAAEEAARMADIEIRAVYASISGDHIKNFSSHGVIAIKENEIGRREVEKVIDAARTVAVPFDREMLHVIPTGFVIDGQNGIINPCGMSGVRLEAHVQIITGSATPVQNLVKSCQRAGLDVIDVVLEPVASSGAVLTYEEKNMGAGLIDIGGGKSNITLFNEGNMRYTAVLNVGGNNFTNDVAIGLRIPASEAERLKKDYGCTLLSMIRQDEEMVISYSGDKPARKIPRQHLIEVLQPRAEELFCLIKEEMQKSGYYGVMASGVVLTGGASLMQGMDTMAENILELPVRIGTTRGIKSITDSISGPLYSTGVGLVLYGAKDLIWKDYGDGLFSDVRARVKGWMGGLFR